MKKPEGKAVVYCEGAFLSTYGKTAHGLVRFTERYKIVAVIDSTLQGKDAGEVLDGAAKGIPLVGDLEEAFALAKGLSITLSHFVIGIATDGGYLTPELRAPLLEALKRGLNLDSGLHDFLNDDAEMVALAKEKGIILRDVRRPSKESNHLFSGKISDVKALKIALLGTDSAIGKRTTSWLMVHGLQNKGYSAEMIGTGQTAWMQGAQYSMVMDSLLNDYVSGELEHLLWTAWKETSMDFAVIEGQGSLMNPAYPGGFEILAACRPDCIVLQHAPARVEYDGFPGYPLDSIEDQIFLIEFLSKKKVIALTVNHENLDKGDIEKVCEDLEKRLSIPVLDPLWQGIDRLLPLLERIKNENNRG